MWSSPKGTVITGESSSDDFFNPGSTTPPESVEAAWWEALRGAIILGVLWKGSIYKLLWPNLMVYIMMYAILSVIYRFMLSDHSRMVFEKLSLHCQTYGELIPLSFVLGFYVSIVIKRWWDQYMTIPWPDALAVYVSTFISGQDDRARLMRRTIMRYANLSLLLALRMMSPTVKKRFPTLEHLVEAGFLMKNEKDIMDNLETKTPHPKYWLPLVWAAAVARRARREGKVPDDFALKTLIDEIVKFRGGCGGLLNFDWISIPLVYTQVVTLAVYSYFAATLMGNQYLDPRKGYPTHQIDLVVPVFTLLQYGVAFVQFFFYMGWLLVAETLVNPFGEDDDDFEVNWLIDRNLQISYVIVDEMHEEHPELIKDQYWDQVFPSELPYTEAAKQYYAEPFLGSAFGVDVPQHMQTFVMVSEQAKDSQPETTPVLINGPTRDLGASFSTIHMGSSLSLKKWRRVWKPAMTFPRVASNAYSMNSVSKITDDDYPDDVFSMSGLSFGSNKVLPAQISTERYKGHLYEGITCKSKNQHTKLVRSVSIDGIADHSNPRPFASNTQDVIGTIEMKTEIGREVKMEGPESAVQIWNGKTDLRHVMRNETSQVLDLEYVKNAAKIDCSAIDAFNILIPAVETLLTPKSEPADGPTIHGISKKEITGSTIDAKNNNEEKDK